MSYVLGSPSTNIIGTPPVPLPIAPKQWGYFSHQNTLKNHLKTHTKEKPYLCSHCDKTLSTNGSFKIHTFLNSGTFTYSGASSSITGNILSIAGGGSGGYGSGSSEAGRRFRSTGDIGRLHPHESKHPGQQRLHRFGKVRKRIVITSYGV